MKLNVGTYIVKVFPNYRFICGNAAISSLKIPYMHYVISLFNKVVKKDEWEYTRLVMP
jgi:hypothetical protein